MPSEAIAYPPLPAVVQQEQELPRAIPYAARTLAHILLDLREQRRQHVELDRRWDLIVGIREHEDALGDRMSEIDKRIDALRDEFAAKFEASTGVQWSQVEAAINESHL